MLSILLCFIAISISVYTLYTPPHKKNNYYVRQSDTRDDPGRGLRATAVYAHAQVSRSRDKHTKLYVKNGISISNLNAQHSALAERSTPAPEA